MLLVKMDGVIEVLTSSRPNNLDCFYTERMYYISDYSPTLRAFTTL